MEWVYLFVGLLYDEVEHAFDGFAHVHLACTSGFAAVRHNYRFFLLFFFFFFFLTEWHLASSAIRIKRHFFVH